MRSAFAARPHSLRCAAGHVPEGGMLAAIRGERTVSHEIEHTQPGHSFAEDRSCRSAWHELGTVLPPGRRSFAEFMAQVPFLNYRVEKIATANGSTGYQTRRTDTQRVLGTVPPEYLPLQNAEAFGSAIGPLLDAGVVQPEAAGVLRGGADAWVLVRIDGRWLHRPTIEIFGDEIAPYGLIRINHSGAHDNLVALTPIRVVCANTLGLVDSGAAVRAAWVQSTGGAAARLVEAAWSVFALVIDGYEQVAMKFAALKGCTLDEGTFQRLVILPTFGAHPAQRPDFDMRSPQAERAIAAYEKRRDELVRLWHAGTGHMGDSSAWEAYNGLVELIDHDTDAFPIVTREDRLEALVDGRLAQVKEAVLAGLYAHAHRTAIEQDAATASRPLPTASKVSASADVAERTLVTTR